MFVRSCLPVVTLQSEELSSQQNVVLWKAGGIVEHGGTWSDPSKRHPASKFWTRLLRSRSTCPLCNSATTFYILIQHLEAFYLNGCNPFALKPPPLTTSWKWYLRGQYESPQNHLEKLLGTTHQVWIPQQSQDCLGAGHMPLCMNPEAKPSSISRAVLVSEFSHLLTACFAGWKFWFQTFTALAHCYST